MVRGEEISTFAESPGGTAAGDSYFPCWEWPLEWPPWLWRWRLNSGFRETLQDKLLGVTAHISLTRPGPGGIHDYNLLADKLGKIPGVRSVTPGIYQTVLLSFGGQAKGVVLKGIEVEREKRSDEALQKLTAGRLDLAADAEGIEGLLVGKQLAGEWKLRPGDYVTLTSPQGRLTPYGLIPRTRPLSSSGCIRFGFL